MHWDRFAFQFKSRLRESILCERKARARFVSPASGTQTSAPASEIKELLHSYGIKNALVRVYGDVTLEDVEDAILENVTLYKPSVVIGNKLDLLTAKNTGAEFENKISKQLPVLLTSCLTGQGLARVGEETFVAWG